ncbi:MAG TPA: serine hydrolase, partial [Pyrinomonadaceae bacterium]|nr:serine hydrolase [Pyrinomonadaceae bacterium]
KASWDEIWTWPKLPDGKTSNYGFGWGTVNVGETTYVSHGGGIAGFNSFIARFPNENLTVFVVANTNSRLIQPMAIDIAGLYLPKVGAVLAAQRAAKNAPPIADTDPETTKFLRSAFEKMVTGEISADLFDAAMQKALFPDRVKELKGPLGGQGAIKAFELMRAENNAEAKVRVYRITFESGLRVNAHFALDPQGKISGAGFRPEQ